MDELKLVLNTKYMRSIITKILAKAIYKKTGYRIDIEINEVKVETYGGKVKIHMDLNAEMNSGDLVEALKTNDIL